MYAIPPDPAELCTGDSAPTVVVFNHHVPRTVAAFANRVTSNHAVVSDVRIGHKTNCHCDLRRPAALFRPRLTVTTRENYFHRDDQLRPFP